MKTASIASQNPRLAGILSLSLLALAAPACVAGAPGESEPDAPEAAEPSGSADPAPAMANVKAVPARPALAANVSLGGELPEKPAHAHGATPVSPNINWQVTLGAGMTTLWPTQYSTLTATANADVGPTPYYIRIRSLDNNAVIASCGTGTTCPIPVTYPTKGCHSFEASIEDASNNVQVSSNKMNVCWMGTQLSFSANPTNVALGGQSTLTATTADDISSSPFYTEIFDTTTGTLLQSCGFGTSCSVAVSQADASTHSYQAFLSLFGASLPLPGLELASGTSYVTWEYTNADHPFWNVSLSSVPHAGYVNVTATASADVGPTPYYIQIFDENGTRLAICGGGTTCSAKLLPSASDLHVVAFVADNSATLPANNVQASSNMITFPPFFGQ